jgi:hypothetical protein
LCQGNEKHIINITLPHGKQILLENLEAES